MSNASLRFVIRETPYDSYHYNPKKSLLDCPQECFDFYRKVVESDDSYEGGKENFVVACLNTRLEVIGYNIVHVGTINETYCNPTAIFRAALLANAYAITVFHNHPSGDPSPSQADIAVTDKLVKAADIMSIRLVDHLIIGASYYSFRESGRI